MAHNNVGERVKSLRKGNDMTLKDLSEATGFSIGFLSQLERGLTTVAIESLEKIARAMNVDITYFFVSSRNREEIVLKSYEKEVYQVLNDNVIYHLTNNIEDRDMLPRVIEILPTPKKDTIYGYGHKGEEFIYVLEGVLTLALNDEVMELYPGDSAHFDSAINHDWSNHTNKIVRFLVVNLPNTLSKKAREKFE